MVRMRTLLPLVILAVCVAAVPAGAGTPLEVLTDPAGDIEAQAGGQGVPAPVEGATELRSLVVDEHEGGFFLSLRVESLETTPHEVWTVYWVAFRHHDQDYRVELYREDLQYNVFHRASLQRHDPGQDSWFHVAGVPVEVDAAAATYRMDVPRDHLFDSSGAVPFPDRELGAFVAEATTWYNPFTINIMGENVQPAALRDRMPDTGMGGVPFPVRHGLAQTGHARLASDEPFRVSNGAATTFVFEVNARNVGDQDDSFTFDAKGAPSNWDVRLPSSVLSIPAGGSREVPVVVQMPFAHAHGSQTAFVLEMRSNADPGAVGRVELGVTYPAIPQPAGHHDTIQFHSRDHSADNPAWTVFGTAFGTLFGFDGLHSAYMNAIEDDGVDDAVPVGGGACEWSPLPEEGRYCWQIPLGPGLQMGLDFDLSRQGVLTASIATAAPMPETRLGGHLVYLEPLKDGQAWWERDSRVLAEVVPTEPQDLDADDRATFEAVIKVLPEADLVPYQRGAGLVLELQATTGRPDNSFLGPRLMPSLLPGGNMRLPLFEYEDPVADAFAAAEAVALHAAGPQERPVNPGRTVLFMAHLENRGELEDTFRLGLVGANADWARVLESERVRLAAGQDAKITVAVTAPADARPGERADLMLEAASSHSVDARSLLRLVVTVDTEEDIPDEAATAQGIAAAGAKQSPALAVPLLLGLLLGAATRRR